MKKVILEISKDWNNGLKEVLTNKQATNDEIIEGLKNIDKFKIVEDFNIRNNCSSIDDDISFIRDLINSDFNFGELSEDAELVLDAMKNLKLTNICKNLSQNNVELLFDTLNLNKFTDNIHKGKLYKFIKKERDLEYKRANHFINEYLINEDIKEYIANIYNINIDEFLSVIYYIFNFTEINDKSKNDKTIMVLLIFKTVIHLYEIKSRQIELFNKIDRINIKSVSYDKCKISTLSEIITVFHNRLKDIVNIYNSVFNKSEE